MSLIHDSLRKLELEPQEIEKSHEDELVSSSDFFEVRKKTIFNKLWVILISTVGILITFYAYSMLKDYKIQNKILIDDINNLKNISEKITNVPVVELINEQKPAAKTIIQTPINIKAVSTAVENTSKNKVIKAPRKSIANNRQEAKILRSNKVNNPLIQTKIIATIPLKLKTKSSVISNKKEKLSVKQTRRLIAQLQILIEEGDNQKVTDLLSKLKESSGQTSLVYLRMNAYWLAKINKPIQAMAEYKKIIYYKPDDIQAGTNLALLEVKVNQIASAIKRLNALKKRNPTNKVVAEYLSKIESLNVE
jgi:tetratricopeptide (TPR) repeat protein